MTNLRIGDLVEYSSPFGHKRYGVVRDLRKDGLQVWAKWADTAEDARKHATALESEWSWVGIKNVTLVSNGVTISCSYCNACGGYGKHRLMCPTMRQATQ